MLGLSERLRWPVRAVRCAGRGASFVAVVEVLERVNERLHARYQDSLIPYSSIPFLSLPSLPVILPSPPTSTPNPRSAHPPTHADPKPHALTNKHHVLMKRDCAVARAHKGVFFFFFFFFFIDMNEDEWGWYIVGGI